MSEEVYPDRFTPPASPIVGAGLPPITVSSFKRKNSPQLSPRGRRSVSSPQLNSTTSQPNLQTKPQPNIIRPSINRSSIPISPRSKVIINPKTVPTTPNSKNIIPRRSRSVPRTIGSNSIIKSKVRARSKSETKPTVAPPKTTPPKNQPSRIIKPKLDSKKINKTILKPPAPPSNTLKPKEVSPESPGLSPTPKLNSNPNSDPEVPWVSEVISSPPLTNTLNNTLAPTKEMEPRLMKPKPIFRTRPSSIIPSKSEKLNSELGSPVNDLNSQLEVVLRDYVPLPPSGGYIHVSSPSMGLTTSPTKTQNIDYLKATTKNGYTVYIEIDDLKYSPTKLAQDAPRFVERMDGVSIPRSSMIGAIECSGMDVCGVAYECMNGICFVARDLRTLEPIQINVVSDRAQKTDQVENRVQEEGNLVPYPVVRLSEIMINPSLVELGIRNTTHRLRKWAYHSANDEIQKFVRSADQTLVQATILVDLTNEKIKELNETIDQLETAHDNITSIPSPTDDQIETRRKVSHNLYIRHEMIRDIFQLGYSYQQQRNQLEATQRQIQERINYINNKYIGIPYMYE